MTVEDIRAIGGAGGLSEWRLRLSRLLRCFPDSRAHLALYLSTHSSLVVELTRSDGERAFLVLSDCVALSMPTRWIVGRPQIVPLPDEERLFRFVDADAGVDVEFGYLDTYEDYPFPPAV